jgi:hypothetical protein
VAITNPDQIDVDLMPELFDRQLQKRPGDGHARIVDEAGQPLAGKRAAHVGCGRLHRRLIGHIED